MKNTLQIQENYITTLLLKGDKEGIRLLYKHYNRLIFGLIYKVVKSEEVAENVMQDTFVKVWQKIDTYDTSKGRLISWVMQIARNSALDMVRSKGYKKNQQLNPVDEVLANDQKYSNMFKVDDIGVREIVNKLEPKHRKLVDLLYFEGFTQSEAAKELDIPLGTVKSRIRKAFSELRRMLD